MANMDEHSLLWQCLMKLILIVCFSKKKTAFSSYVQRLIAGMQVLC